MRRIRLKTGLVTSMLAAAWDRASAAGSPGSAVDAAAASEPGSEVSSPPLEQPTRASASKSAPSMGSHDSRSLNIDTPPGPVNDAAAPGASNGV